MAIGRDIPFEQRTPEDGIPPEMLLRRFLDRDISRIDTIFSAALGAECSPLYIASRTLQAAGSLAVMDIGSGTGNTMRSFRDWLEDLDYYDQSRVSIDGISLHDYRSESMHQETNEAMSKPSDIFSYYVGDASEMPGIVDDSYDLTYAHASLGYANGNPAQWLWQMLRITRPLGHILFTTEYEQIYSDSPAEELFRLIDRIEENNTKTRTCTYLAKPGPRTTAYFYHINIPAEKVIPA